MATSSVKQFIVGIYGAGVVAGGTIRCKTLCRACWWWLCLNWFRIACVRWGSLPRPLLSRHPAGLQCTFPRHCSVSLAAVHLTGAAVLLHTPPSLCLALFLFVCSQLCAMCVGGVSHFVHHCWLQASCSSSGQSAPTSSPSGSSLT